MDNAQTENSAAGGASELTDVLAAKIARAIFEAGDEPIAFGGKTLRIQFMGGHWPDAEKPMGGFCEDALTQCIAKVLAANKELTGAKCPVEC